MLVLDIAGQELYDEESNRFISTVAKQYRFEHSLLSITEWEHKYRKPFMGFDEKSEEEMVDYIMMMSLDYDFNIFDLTQEHVGLISKYITDSNPTATTIKSSNDSGSRRVMTSEYIYACMAIARIPFECESWNIYRLLMLLGVVNELQKPPVKMTREEQIKQQRELNAKRQAEMAARRKKNEGKS